MKTIALTQGKVALIDDQDWDKVSPHSWVASKRGKTWYAVARIAGRMHLLHRWITGETRKIDHRDRDGLNNCRSNLRVYASGQNQANTTKYRGSFSSVYKGVSWDKVRGQWRASANVSGKATNLGRFNYAHEAALEYDRAALKEWGEFALLNFPRASRRDTPTILMVGWGRSGKDFGAELLADLTGLRYGFSFSRAALPFMADFLKQDEETAWNERHQHREKWKAHLDYLREGDETLLAEMALCNGDILAGLRDKKELYAVRRKGLFNHVLWVHRDGIPKDPTTTFGPEDCDETIFNPGTLKPYRETLRNWARRKGLLK